MMRMHPVDRVLRSPEGEDSGGGGAPSGQPQGETSGQSQGQPQTGGEYVPRSMFEESIKTRQSAKEREREALARVELLERENAELRQARQPKPPEQPQPKPTMDTSAEFRDRLDRFEIQQQAKEREARDRELAKKIADGLPERHKSLAPMLLRGLHPNGLPDGDLDQLASATLAAIKNTHTSLFEPLPGSPLTAIQVGPDGKIAWNSITSVDQVPDGRMHEMPPEVFQRLRRGNTTNRGLLLGSRSPSK